MTLPVPGDGYTWRDRAATLVRPTPEFSCSRIKYQRTAEPRVIHRSAVSCNVGWAAGRDADIADGVPDRSQLRAVRTASFIHEGNSRRRRWRARPNGSSVPRTLPSSRDQRLRCRYSPGGLNRRSSRLTNEIERQPSRRCASRSLLNMEHLSIPHIRNKHCARLCRASYRHAGN